MGDDDIFYCQKRGAEIGVVSAFSTGMSRPVDIDGTDHVTNIGTSSDANDFKCSFRRPLSVTKVHPKCRLMYIFFLFYNRAKLFSAEISSPLKYLTLKNFQP